MSKLYRKPHIHIIFRSEEESVQTKFSRKKNLILLIYIDRDYTGAENQSFSQTLGSNLNVTVRDGEKS